MSRPNAYPNLGPILRTLSTATLIHLHRLTHILNLHTDTTHSKDHAESKEQKLQETKNEHQTSTLYLVVNNSQVTRNQLVLQHGTLGNLDLVTIVGNNDNGTPKRNVSTENHITLNSQMIQLDHLRNALKPLLELSDLLECIAQLDYGRLGEHPSWVHDQLAVLERVKVRSDQQQIRAGLDGQETGSWHIDTFSATEVLNSCTDGSLELNDSLARLQSLVVDNDLQVQFLVVQDALNSRQVKPKVVGVEDLELLNRLEVLDVLGRNLSNLEQANSTFVVDQSTTLNVGFGLISDLRDELGLSVNHVLVDVKVDIGAQVVDVGDEKVLLAGSDQTIEQARVVHGIEQVAMTGRIPEVLVVGSVAGAGEERLLVDTRVSRLVEGEDFDVVVGVLLDDTGSVVVSVERVHEDEGNVDVVATVEVLDLSDGKIEEGHAITNLDDGLGTSATHGGTETTVEFENGKLVEDRRIGSLTELGVRGNLLGGWGLDFVPDELLALGLLGEVSVEEVKKVGHFSFEGLCEYAARVKK